MTLDDLGGHLRNAGLIKCNSTNICETFSRVLTDTARRAVPRRQLSFLSVCVDTHMCCGQALATISVRIRRLVTLSNL